MTLRAYIVDDEQLAIDRLSRLLEQTQRVTLLGSNTRPKVARDFLEAHPVDVLFLDISMPAMSGFELLASLSSPPNVVFITAYDEHALKAFEANAIDYLLKPVDPRHLDRALNKVERLGGHAVTTAELRSLMHDLAASLQGRASNQPDRIASRLGNKVCFVELAHITHFYAEDKLTYAVADGKAHSIDLTLSALEQKLDPRQFIRIHRTALINADWVKELSSTGSGRVVVHLKDARKTELAVARNRVHEVKMRLGV